MIPEERIGVAFTAQALAALRVCVVGQCEAIDLVPTDDDAEERRCPWAGVLVREHTGHGHTRHRAVCPRHGYESAYCPW